MWLIHILTLNKPQGAVISLMCLISFVYLPRSESQNRVFLLLLLLLYFALRGNFILLLLMVELFLVLLAVCKIPSTPIYWMDRILENETEYWSLLVILNFTLPNVVCHFPGSNKFTTSAKHWHNNITQVCFPFYTGKCCFKLHLDCSSETFSPGQFPFSVFILLPCFPSSPWSHIPDWKTLSKLLLVSYSYRDQVLVNEWFWIYSSLWHWLSGLWCVRGQNEEWHCLKCLWSGTKSGPTAGPSSCHMIYLVTVRDWLFIF